MRITPENVVVCRGVEIYLDVVLTIVEQRCRGVGGIVPKTGSGWSWVQGRIKQILRYGIDRFHSCDIVVENGSVPVFRIVELLARRITQSASETTGVGIVTHANIREVSGPLSCREDVEKLGCGRVIETLPLVIKEEEELVLEYRATYGASKHVPAQGGSLSAPKSIFPGIRVQLVIAEVLPQITVETVGTRFDSGTDNAALEITEFGRGVAGNQVEFLNGIRRGCVAEKIV